MWRMVFTGLKATPTPASFRTRLILSDVSCTHGIEVTCLYTPKDTHTSEDKSCVVYHIPCSDCDYVYIGQTKRGLKSRLADHKRATSKLRPELSALCEHAMDFNHTIDPKVMNRSDGDSLPNVYRSFVVVVVWRGISSKTDGRTKAEGLSFYHPGHQTAWVRC